MFKKLAALHLILFLSAGIAAGCEQRAAPIPTLTTPAPLPAPVAKIYTPKELNVQFVYTIIEAMASRKIDIGFLPPIGYLQVHDERDTADLLLQAQSYGVDDATGEEDKTKLVDSYKAMIIVKADSPIKTIEDLRGKKIAWQDVTSFTGYIYPALELKRKNIDPHKDVRGIVVKNPRNGIVAVLNDEVDGAAVFHDASDS